MWYPFETENRENLRNKSSAMVDVPANMQVSMEVLM